MDGFLAGICIAIYWRRMSASSSESPMVLAQILCDVSIINYLLWVSLKCLDGITQRLKDVIKVFTTLSDVWRFTKEVRHCWVVIDGVIKGHLQGHLRLTHKEVANNLRNRVLDAAEHDVKVAVDSLSHFQHE